MSKIISASCSGGQVVAEGLEIDADILSQGTKASEGVVIIDEDRVTYVTSNATDIKELIERLNTIIAQVVTIATGLDTASNSPGGQTSNISQLTTLKNQLNATKDNLK